MRFLLLVLVACCVVNSLAAERSSGCAGRGDHESMGSDKSIPCPIGHIGTSHYDPLTKRQFMSCTDTGGTTSYGAKYCLLQIESGWAKEESILVDREDFSLEAARVDAKLRENPVMQKVGEAGQTNSPASGSLHLDGFATKSALSKEQD